MEHHHPFSELENAYLQNHQALGRGCCTIVRYQHIFKWTATPDHGGDPALCDLAARDADKAAKGRN